MNSISKQYKDRRTPAEIAEAKEKRQTVVEDKQTNIRAIVESAKKPLQNKIDVLEKKLKKEQYYVNEYKNVITKLTSQLANRNK